MRVHHAKLTFCVLLSLLHETWFWAWFLAGFIPQPSVSTSISVKPVYLCIFAVASMILYQLDLVLKKCFYPKSLFFIWCFSIYFTILMMAQQADNREQRRAREWKKYQSIDIWQKSAVSNWIFASLHRHRETLPFQSMLHFEERKTRILTHTQMMHIEKVIWWNDGGGDSTSIYAYARIWASLIEFLRFDNNDNDDSETYRKLTFT